MKDKIEEILKGLSLEGLDTEDVTNQITKVVALHTVPKDTYNDLSKKFKNEESARTSLESELEGLKTKSAELTTENARLDALEKEFKAEKIKNNRLQAKTIFKEANIADDKIESLLDQVVSEDETKTLKLANNFADILKTKVDETKKVAESDNLQNMAKPTVKSEGNATKEVTKEDFEKMSYAERKELFLSDVETYNRLSE